MQGTADFHYDITDALLPQAALTTRQRLTLLLTCSIRSRREWSAWLAWQPFTSPTIFASRCYQTLNRFIYCLL